MSAIKVVLRKAARISYPHLGTPRAANPGDTPKYSCTILIPKDHTDDLAALNAAIKQAHAEAMQPKGAWGGKAPAAPKIAFYDGDKPNPNSGEDWGPECKGCYFLRCTTTSAPDVIDRNNQKILDPDTEVYAGCWCNFSVNVKAYDYSGSKGIGFYLNAVRFVKDGEPLGAHNDAKADFADIELEPAATADPFAADFNPFG